VWHDICIKNGKCFSAERIREVSLLLIKYNGFSGWVGFFKGLSSRAGKSVYEMVFVRRRMINDLLIERKYLWILNNVHYAMKFLVQELVFIAVKE